ncbi:MAG: 5-formyltetrahydrofolate cyclo-ligase [Lentisphaeria bacterium]|nr:5-formyltetrahydrofolate cyclo-ligase [Lentisphaeria bacterium]
MTSSIYNMKQELRKEKLHARRSLAPEFRISADHAILERLESLPEVQGATVIAAYASDGTEPDLMPLLKRAAQAGKKICLPRWRQDSTYEMAVADADFTLVEGKWKMPEPPPEAPAVPDSVLQNALWLIPGVAFDEKCGRLGRGKGIYDRFLAVHEGAMIGIFYECQKTAVLPVESHDQPLDLVVTEKEIYRRFSDSNTMKEKE